MTNVKFIAPYVIENGKRVAQFPGNCIHKKATYEAEISVTFCFSFKGKIVRKEENVIIGAIPVMTGSSLCNLVNKPRPTDADLPHEQQSASTRRWLEMMKLEFSTGLCGNFVRDGTCRIITFQERNAFNHPMIVQGDKKYAKTVEVRNSVANNNTTAVIAAHMTYSDHIVCTMKYLDDKKEIYPILFFHALGFTSVKEILSLIIHPDDPLFQLSWVRLQIQKMIEDVAGLDHVEELSKLGMEAVSDRAAHVDMILKRKFLHHYSSFIEKAVYFGNILYTLILASVPDDIKKQNPHIKYAIQDDRDHFGDKVLNTESSLFSNVFYTATKKMFDGIEKAISAALDGKSPEVAQVAIKELNAKMLFPESDISRMPITVMFGKALGTNKWGNVTKDGVSTVYDPINYNAAVILLMRSCMHIDAYMGNLDPRMVHGSYPPFIDLFDTPEGDTIGVNKVISTSTYVSSEIDVDHVTKYVLTIIKSLETFRPDSSKDRADSFRLRKVFMNNKWLGSAEEKTCLKIYHKLVDDKRNGRIDHTFSIVWRTFRKELHMFSQEGRLLTPLLLVKNGEILLKENDWKLYPTWKDLCGSGKVEMLDPNEFEYVKGHAWSISDFVEMTPEEQAKITHICLHPVTMFGAGVGSIIYPHMTQGPRNSYGANQERQAVGSTMRFDTPRNLMNPQRPLVTNKIASHILHYDENPAGMNVKIAVMPNDGYETEDGYVIDKGAIERGLFTTNKVIKVVQKIDGDDEWLEIPTAETCHRFRMKNTDNIGPDGIIKKGVVVYKNDPLLCKVTREQNGKFIKTDTTLFHTDESVCWVSDVVVTKSGFRNGQTVKIVLRETRLCKNGNKFAPREAQKGTVTRICPTADQPFCPHTKTTITVCISPMCFPSRMTINYLYEILYGTYLTLPDKNRIEAGKKGKYAHNGQIDGTAYEQDPVEQLDFVMSELKRMGFRQDGCEEVYDGRTGEPLTVQIFTGFAHIQALKHMVDDKMNVRATGPIAPRMRCPTEGRAALGGQKTGCMEKDVFSGSDVPEMLADRMCLSSDKFDTTVCKYCGIIESHNKAIKARCKGCQKEQAMVPITLPYSTKFVFQELQACCIFPRILVDEVPL